MRFADETLIKKKKKGENVAYHIPEQAETSKMAVSVDRSKRGFLYRLAALARNVEI